MNREGREALAGHNNKKKHSKKKKREQRGQNCILGH